MIMNKKIGTFSVIISVKAFLVVEALILISHLIFLGNDSI